MRKVCTKVTVLLLCVLLIFPVGVFGADLGKLPGKGSGAGLGTYNAILIGIDHYESFPTLSTPVSDVEALAELLRKDYGFRDVTLLTDRTGEKPTASNIQKLIREKAREMTEKDNLLIYYAGHGYLDSEGTGDGYWIPVNGMPDDPSTWIPHDQITKLMGNEKSKVKSFILIADSCYSGAMMRSIRIEPPGRADDDTLTKRLLEGGGKKSRIIVSSGANEPVPDTAFGTRHSLFAHYLLKGLKENKERYMDMGLFFNTKVKPEVEKRIKTKPQISRLNSAVDENGIFVLTKAGVAERVPRPDQSALNEQLLKEKAALEAKLKAQQAEFESRMATLAAQQTNLNQDLERLRATERSNKEQIEALQKSQKAEKQEYEVRLRELKSKQSSLNDELGKLEEIDRKNKADGARLQAALKERTALSAEKMAEIEREQQRVAELNGQIESQRRSLQGKEQSLAEAQANLKKTEAQMLAKVREEEKKIALLKSKEKEIEEKALQAEQARKKIEEDTRVAALNRSKIEEETRLAAQKKKELEAELARTRAEVEKARVDMAGIYAKSKGGDAQGRFVILGDIVFDKQTNLMWLKDANFANMGKDFESAENFVANLQVDGYGNWQLPTKEEWRSLIPDNVKGIDNSLPDNPFRNVVISGQYWVSSITGSQGINLGHGSISRLNKKNAAYIWPVRYATPEEIKKFKSQ